MTTSRQIGPGKRGMSCPEEAATVALLRTSDALGRPVAALLKRERLSTTQYNVLRILRGAGEGLLCRQIGERLISRDPDTTRLLDRLEQRGLIARCRENPDRRHVVTSITPDGLELLARLDAPMTALHRRLLGHLGPKKLETLTSLLEACRSGDG